MSLVWLSGTASSPTIVAFRRIQRLPLFFPFHATGLVISVVGNLEPAHYFHARLSSRLTTPFIGFQHYN